MLEFWNTYILIGLVWSLLHEFGDFEKTFGYRIRLILLWPFTFFAFVIGFLEAFFDSFNNNR